MQWRTEEAIAIANVLIIITSRALTWGEEAPPISNPLNPGAQHGPI